LFVETLQVDKFSSTPPAGFGARKREKGSGWKCEKRGEERREDNNGKRKQKMTREVFSVSLHATRSFYRSLLLL